MKPSPFNEHEPLLPSRIACDERIVLTLDAGGTNFAFSALQRGAPVGESCVLPACGDDLDASLKNLVAGFEKVIASLPSPPAAISFAFPGPADYPSGVVFNVGNLPAYGDGVPIGPLLEERFGLRTFLNNDGDLFTLGEAVGGLLPAINEQLASVGAEHRCRHLFGVTLGTGLGGGLVVDGRLCAGDNNAAAEIWRLRGGESNDLLAEEDASIRAVRTSYAHGVGIDAASAPQPAEIYEIARGEADGDQHAAAAAFEDLGRAVGEVVATATCLVDPVVVIGGGLSGAADVFMPALLESLNQPLSRRDGETLPRLGHAAFDLTTEAGIDAFARRETRRVAVPGSSRTVACRTKPCLGVGVSRLGANRAAWLGAYAFAIQQLDDT
ncbi:MAG: ROK family protein [Planctomycetota bacterium]